MMKVEVVAHTVWWGHPEFWRDPDSSHLDAVAEFAGRACYQSFHRPNPATATNHAYLARILDRGHESVLEHGSVTFYITGVSRALTHELIRHRHLSFSQLSQRYVSEHTEPVVPPTIERAWEDPSGVTEENPEGADPVTIGEMWEGATDSAQVIYDLLVQALEAAGGLSKKQVREAARSVLPNATETKVVVTGNLRAWRDFLRKRLSPHADQEMQQLAREIRVQLGRVAPHSVQDLPLDVEITQL